MDDISDDGYSYEFSKIYKNPKFTLNYRDLWLKLAEHGEMILKYLYRILHDERFQGKRLLDIGCGPSVFRTAIASKFFSEIIVSDYSEYNLEEIQTWMNDEPSSKYWDPLFKQQAILKGFRNVQEGIEIIKSRTREKLTKVLPCDVLQKEIVPVDIGKFDVVFSIFCLESACSTLEAYKSSIKKLKNYLLPDGELVLGIALDSPYYFVNNIEEKISQLSISEEMVNKILVEEGFKKKHYFIIENNKIRSVEEPSGILILSATIK